MIQANRLTYRYDQSNQFAFPDIKCNAGEELLIIGPSGSGKTTLLHILAGILRSVDGDVELNEIYYSSLNNQKLDILRGKSIGIIFQKHHFFSSLNTRENILLRSSMCDGIVEEAWFDELVAALDLGDKLQKNIKYLSQGELQRVAIARALLLKPALVLADEPTSSLDDVNCEKVVAVLKKVCKKSGSALIIVTHDQRIKNVVDNKVVLR